MEQAHPLQRWKQIVFPIFWPVFLWNLRHFVARLERLMETHGREGRIVWAISWWGAIYIDVVYPEDRPQELPGWAETLAVHSRRIRAMCLGLSDHVPLFPPCKLRSGLGPPLGIMASLGPRLGIMAGLGPPHPMMAGRGPPYLAQPQTNP